MGSDIFFSSRNGCLMRTYDDSFPVSSHSNKLDYVVQTLQGYICTFWHTRTQMHYWDWENWQGAALMVGHQATTDFPHAGGNCQSAASMESRSNSKLFTSMQCSNTPKKATTASCSVVWVAKFNGPLHPLALVI
ncbi:unnamed protein product [Musa acuminata var. zebrina]